MTKNELRKCVGNLEYEKVLDALEAAGFGILPIKQRFESRENFIKNGITFKDDEFEDFMYHSDKDRLLMLQMIDWLCIAGKINC